MQHERVSTNYPWLPHNVDSSKAVPEYYQDMPIQPLGNMQRKHDEYMAGCREHYQKRANRCDQNENDRISMTMRQPQSMRNYTEIGYAKIRAPDHVFQLLSEFWEANKGNQKGEKWPPGNIYTNHWLSPSTMVSVEDQSLEGGGYVLKQHIWNAARDTISEWTGQQLAECSLYGIRIYHEGSMLAPHVDRLPLVSSAIINVDQDVDEPWPLEVIGHDGIAANVTMEPGDMVLYESHSIIHGRPFPLKGRFMANVFIHFEPIGPVGGEIEYTGELPPYLIPGSPEEPNWTYKNPDGHKIMNNVQFATGSTQAHQYALKGDVEKLERHLDQHANHVNVRDGNGWTPLHEAVRSQSVQLVQLLLDRGAEVNARTGRNGDEGSVLWWAKRFNDEGENDEVIKLLVERGAKEMAPVAQEL